MERAEDGKFAPKFDQAKSLCSFRLSQYAIAYLDIIARCRNVSKTDVIESLVRGEYDKDLILAAIDRYIELESQRDRKGNQYGKNFSTSGRDWTHLIKFRKACRNFR